MSKPQLAIVVDAEEEFDWTQPFSRSNQATSSMREQCAAHKIYDRLGIVPTYVIDYPVAIDPMAVDYLRGLMTEDRAEIGTHPHPWVTPPHGETVSTHNSYICNLPADLQRAKITALHRAIEDAFSFSPKIFKAGRYGFGKETRTIITELGYEIDCSHVPHTNFRSDGGPDFRNTPDRPHWLDDHRKLLEIPLTVGFFGYFHQLGPVFSGVFDDVHAKMMRLPALLGRSGMVARSRLSPEGITASEQQRLLKAMVNQGQQYFTLSYHSPSLVPGHTPYVRNQADLDVFLASIDNVLRYFRDELGGEFTTLTKMRERYLARG